ncbi:MAG: type II secretion system protein N [Gammaproteobacteria bacterium]|nr:type II secretion system protein N [Gammaproteobacteria bacterium]
MRRWWHYLLVGVVAWVLFMAWRFPAPVAYGMVVERLGAAGAAVRLAGIEGTLWRGEAQQLQYRQRLVGHLDWQLSPWGLLLGRLGGELRVTQDNGYLLARGHAPFGSGEPVLTQLEGRLPLTTLQPYLTMVPLPLAGVLSLKLEGVRLSPEGRLQQAEGRLVWHQAGVTAPQPLLFGDLQMTLQNRDEGGIKGEISDSGGPLWLRATLTLGADGAYQLTGEARAAEPSLRQSLALLGRADGQGKHLINLQGRL